MSDDSSPRTEGDVGGQLPSDEDRLHPEVRFEQPEIPVARVVMVLVAIAVVFAGVAGVAFWFLKANATTADRAAEAPYYSVPADAKPAPPRLESLDQNETTASPEVFAKQLAMEHLLHSYGDIAEAGFVHIPIERAMKLVVPAVPVRQGATPPPKGFGLVGGGEPNSGRLYSGAPTWLEQRK